MSKKIDLSNACFIKIGCEACQRYKDNQYLLYGIKQLDCKDRYLSYDEKVKKFLKKRG
jgi:hypothetical protein